MRAAETTRGLLVSVIATLMLGCAQKGPTPLYMWETFPKLQYEALLQGGAPASRQIVALEALAEKSRAGGAALPPGFRAHLAFLKLAVGDPDEARRLFVAEKTAFPESAPYIEQLLKRLDSAPRKDNPA